MLGERGAYLGLACPQPNSIACDRVGLAVWLRRPARSVTATVGKRSWALDDRQWSGPRRHGLRWMFAGFVQPAGMRAPGALSVRPEDGADLYTGRNGIAPRVRLVITLADGTRLATSFRAELAPGWG